MDIETQYKLSIQIALDGFSFLVLSPQTRRILQEKEVLHTGREPFYDWLRVKLAGEEIFREKHVAVNLLYLPEKTTVLPNSLYDKDKERELFTVAFPLQKDEMLLAEKGKMETVLSAIPNDIYKLLQEYFPKAKWQSASSFLAKQTENLKKWNVGVLLLYDKIFLSIFENGKLKLCNSFAFTTKEDLLYYMLYAFDNLEIPIAESCIQLFGNQNYVKFLSSELDRYHDDVILPPQSLSTVAKTAMSSLLLLNS